MLGKTAGGLYWMFRLLERAENTARLIEAGFRIALTRSTDNEGEWKSVLTTAGARRGYDQHYGSYNSGDVINYLLRESDNPSSVLSVTKSARDNARMVRTALTTEVWAAVNENWMTMQTVLKRPIKETDLPKVLDVIRQQSALVRGALHGTMLRNDIYDFSRIGTFIERVDSTARIIDVKYYTLLPSASFVGSNLDNVQWETILRSVSAHRAFKWLNEEDPNARAIASFLILDTRMPRSLSFCLSRILSNLGHLTENYGARLASYDMAVSLRARIKGRDINSIFEEGLHQFIGSVIRDNNDLGKQFEIDYRFNK
jgi:uncharacterized alpha-E superfamily protein